MHQQPLVLLSELDSKKYRAILRFKEQIVTCRYELPNTDLSEEIADGSREIDSFGEISSKRITQTQKRLTQEEVSSLIEKYQSGKTLVELGKEFGCHKSTVGKILERNGIRKRPNCDNFAQEIIAEYQAGKSTQAIAKEFSVDSSTISRVLKKHGIIVHRRRAQAKLDVEKAVEMYREMHTAKEIAQRFGISSKVVIRCLRDQGVKIRSRWDYIQE